MYGLDARAVIAGLILGTAVALAFRGFATGHPRIARLAPWLTPLAALLPPIVVVLATWHPRGWELEGILRVGGVFYGPALVTVALVLLGVSRPYARRRGAFARIAQRPLFWILAPYAVAGGLLGGLALVHPSDALAAPGNATITKTLTAHFTAGTVPATLDASTDQLAIIANTTPALAAVAHNALTGGTNTGALTMGGPNAQVFLTLRGPSGTSAYYDASTGLFSAGPAVPAAPGAGDFAIQRDATSYLLIRGADTNAVFSVNTGTGAVGAWTITTPAFTLTGLAGAGAHAIKRTDGRILIVHGNGLTTTSLYTPPGVGTEGIIAGPAVSAAAGAGALSIPRSADTDWFTLLGNGATTANRYRQTGGTIVGGVDIGTFAAAGVTASPSAVNTGSFAVQYKDGTLANAYRWLIVQGNGTAAFKYDPAAALNQAYTGVTVTGYTAGNGGHAFKRGDGNWILLQPGSATAILWNSTTATVSALAAFTTANPGGGSHSFQRDDGQIVIVRGANSNATNLYDAGWTVGGTYTSEQINPGFVDKWDQLAWTTDTSTGGTINVGFRSAATCATNTGAFTNFTANSTATQAITSATGLRCIQAQAIFARPIPQQSAATSAWTRVWSSTGGVFFDRIAALPVLSDYSLRLVLGQFTITPASATTTAGTQIASTVTLADSRGTGTGIIADYNGTNSLVFAGAGYSPSGGAPTYTDVNSLDQPFGGNTALIFNNPAGVANPGIPNLRPFKAEVATVTATANMTNASAGFFWCAGGTACPANTIVQLDTASPAIITVNPTAVNAGNSTLTPIIASVAGGASQPITVTALDNFKNPISGASTALSVAPVGPTLSATANTNASGVYGGSITTPTLGTYTVSATIAGTPITPTLPISFVNVTGFESTPTLLKDTQTRLANGATVSNTNVAASGVQLNASALPAGTITAGPGVTTGNIGAGAHSLLASNGQVLIIHGNNANTTTVFDGAGAFTNGPALRNTSGAVPVVVPVGQGAHSFRIPSGTNTGKFLLLSAGQGVAADIATANTTTLIDPNGWVVSDGPAMLSGPTGTATSGAGAGAFSVAFSDFGGTFAADPRFLIVHAGGVAGAGGVTNTSIYDASNNTIIAGPALTGAAGDGAFGIVRAGPTLAIFHGNNGSGTTLYTPAASPAIGAMAAGPAGVPAISTGGHAIQYTSAGAGTCAAASVAGAPCVLIVTGGGTAVTRRYDPALNAFAAANGPALSGNAGAGANTLIQSNGKFLTVHGGALTTSSVFDPVAGTVAVGPTTSSGIGVGAHSIQQIDHRYLIVRGATTNQTFRHSAGWIGQGTYTTEWLNPQNVDSWTALGYTTALSGASVSIDLQVAQTSVPAGLVTAQTTLTLNGSNTATLALGATSDRKWVRGVATLTRPIPAFSGAQTGVFLSTGIAVQNRTQTATPTLSSLSFGYRSGYFRITQATPQVAGASFNASGFALVDDTSTSVGTGVITDYTGSHTLVFSGANTAPNGTSIPTAAGTNFGSSTAITFTSGAAATTAFVLYKAETATPAATETVNGTFCLPGGTNSCAVTAPTTIRTLTQSCVVNPANPDAAQSLVSVSPSTVPADDVATTTISITVKDAFQNLSPGVTAPFRAVSITLVPTTLGGEAPTITNATGNVNSSAAYSATMHSGKSGSVTVKVTITSGGDVIPSTLLSAQPTVTFADITLVITPVDSGGTIAGPTVIAGGKFGLKIEAHIVSPSSTDLSFCDGTGTPAAKCDISFTTTAGNAPDGTAPVLSGTLSAVTFSAGFFTTSLTAFDLVCANGQGVSCLTQTSAQTITVTATQVAQPSGHGTVILTGTSSGITVNSAATNSRNGIAGTAAQSFVLVSPSAVGTTTAVGVPTTVSVWTRVVDGFGNAAPASPSRTVTFGSTAGTFTGGVNTAPTATSAGAAVYGFAGPVSLTSTAATTASITATVSDNGASAQGATAYYVANLPRISNGTYYGTLSSTNGAAPVAAPIVGKGVPLAVVATDGANKPALSVSGTTLVSTANACWTVTGTNATGGAYDAGVADAGCTTTATRTATQSGAVLAAQVDITANLGRRTFLKAAQPGATVAHVVAGSATFDYAITVAGYFQVATTSTPNSRQVTAVVDWDGTTTRVIGWFAPEP